MQADVAQRQSNGFVNRRLRVRIPSSAYGRFRRNVRMLLVGWFSVKIRIDGSVSRAAKGADCNSAGGSPSQVRVLPGPLIVAHIAQPVEHILGKNEVSGSNPLVGSSSIPGFSLAAAIFGAAKKRVRQNTRLLFFIMLAH